MSVDAKLCLAGFLVKALATASILAVFVLPALIGIPKLIVATAVLTILCFAHFPGRAYIGAVALCMFFATCAGVASYAMLALTGVTTATELLIQGAL